MPGRISRHAPQVTIPYCKWRRRSGSRKWSSCCSGTRPIQTSPASGGTPLHESLIEGHADIAKILIEAGGREDFLFEHRPGENRRRAGGAGRRSFAGIATGRAPAACRWITAAANSQSGNRQIAAGPQAHPVVDYDLSFIKVPLHYAIHNGDIPFVELLLKAGGFCRIRRLGWRGESPTAEPPLHMAIRRDRRDIVKLLLAYKADLKIRDTFSQMPLHCAAVSGKAEFVEMLLRAEAPDVKAATIRFDLPCSTTDEEETPQHNTPLHFAAASGNPATIKALLAGGGDIEARNVQGNTPLISALEPPIYEHINGACQLQNIRVAIDFRGEKVNAENKQGRTALDIAREPARNYFANLSDAEQQKVARGNYQPAHQTRRQDG